MSANQLLDKLLEAKIIAIVRGIQPDRMQQLTHALLEGGISCMEVTFDQTSAQGTADTLKSIRMIRELFGEQVVLGAGTVLSVEQVETAVEAGASYMISPNTDVAVIKRTKELGAVSMPGALTPSEIVTAWQAGADIVKLFPAGDLGAGYIKSIRAPLAHIPMAAVGGVTPENLKGFFDIGVCSVGVGGNLVIATDIREGRFDRITAVAKRFSQAARELG